VRAFAKINQSLRVLGLRPDGYHDLRTTFQTIALHDTLTFTEAPGMFDIQCHEPGCPADRTNLVWRAAELMWRASGRRGRPVGLKVSLDKRIPMQAGLGGGSSDAAAALRALNAIWRVEVAEAELLSLAATIGADVPFFLVGGRVLGLERGDVLFPLEEPPAAWVVLALPDFGVSTKDAYGWFDHSSAQNRPTAASRSGRTAIGGRRSRRTALRPREEGVNELQGAVAARHPEIDRLVRGLQEQGARCAAMSGSGSAVFGLFEARALAESAAAAVASAGYRVVVTKTLSRRRHRSLAWPRNS
jgi:4-diphosphocytidyl-2-C-methyl-D-erythritol kinase